jgi:citronellol/citronellal dehydrogenase
MSLHGKTMFISGASRGIGLAIAKRVAADGANVALVAKTAEPHPKLEGTIYTAAKEIEDAGGQALPRFDLMNGINVRGTYAVSQACIPHMKGRANPHILTLSPPLLLESKWLKPTAYMMAKYGMTLCGLGMAEELRADGIASNTLWPRTMVATAAVRNLLGGDEAMARARKPEVYSDAAYVIFNKPAGEYTGNAVLCEDVLVDSGVTDLSVYDCVPGSELGVDLWVETPNPPGYRS